MANRSASGYIEEFVQMYFERGYSYRLILCFLSSCHGILLSLRTLKRVLKRLNLRRRGQVDDSQLIIAGSCIFVSVPFNWFKGLPACLHFII